jgi:hypothetical protein
MDWLWALLPLLPQSRCHFLQIGKNVRKRLSEWDFGKKVRG